MKKLITAVIFAMVLAFPTVNAATGNTVATLPAFDVTLNGVAVESGNRQYPFLVYNDITYFPMTYYDCRFLGLTTDWDGETRTLSIGKENITCAYRSYTYDGVNPNSLEVSVCDFNIVVNGKAIDNKKEPYPLLTFRDVTYFPLTWRFTVEEFGWNSYGFDAEKGLTLSSSNPHTEKIALPNLAGSAALDGEYYYYNGSVGDDNYIYSAPIHDPLRARIIHQIPAFGMFRRASFINSEDGVYLSYIVGSTPVMSSKKAYKINNDGTVSAKLPDKYFYSNHGRSELSLRKSQTGVEGITIEIEAVNEYPDSPTTIVYSRNGESKSTVIPGSVRFGRCMIDGGEFYRVSAEDSMQILGEKLYFSAYDMEEKSGSNDLYVLDTETGKTEKLIDGIEGAFYAYNGWSNALQGQTVMIIFGKDGRIMRYTEKDGKALEVAKSPEDGNFVLERAVGGATIYVIQKTVDGGRTIVRALGDYASGNADDCRVVFETSTGTNHAEYDGRLFVATAGEAPADKVRTAVFPWANDGLYISDAVTSEFLFGNTLIYTLGDGSIVRIDEDKK